MYLGCFLVCFYFFPMVSQSDLFLNPYFLFLYLLPIGVISCFTVILLNQLASLTLPIGVFSRFRTFLPNPLASLTLPIGVFSRFLTFLPN